MAKKTKKDFVKAPVPPKRVEPEVDKAVEVETPRPAGPTRAEYEALDRRCSEFMELLRAEREGRRAAEAAAKEADMVGLLLQKGLDPAWTDEAVMDALAGCELESGPMGAFMAIFERERRRAHEDAEVLEESGKFDLLPGAVGAARRLRVAQDRIVALFEASRGLGEWESPEGKRSSRLRG